ncbi:DUF1016 N-terminal domain-containing protein [Cycloclasticus pugetii]|uniref:DUF1016 N-terminal domain-containing protein n=1 Tax=Cycloclasticus pugetii TaxID=34068 RepID=UPI003A8F3F62
MGPITNQNDTLYAQIAEVLQQARHQVKAAINHQMVAAYWEIGRLIVEQEQQGQTRAEYGKQQLEALSKKLTQEFGKGFDARNLRRMRAFYKQNPIWNAVRPEFGTHCVPNSRDAVSRIELVILLLIS